MRHEEQAKAAHDRTDEEIWTTTTPKRMPCAVAHVTDDGLNDESGKRRSKPQHRNLIGLGPQKFVDGTHVGHLQCPAKLNTHKPETHVPDFPET